MNTYKLAVIGNPIKQSNSPWLHNQFASQFGIQIDYIKILAPLDQFTEIVKQFREQGGYGLNVTAPFKNQAYQLCTHVSERAKIAESVNTILFQSNGEIYGDNTDGIGLIRDITHNLNYALRGKTLVLLGAGGALQGILKPILDEKPARVIIANRTEEKAIALAAKFKMYGNVVGGHYADLSSIKADVVIDGTSFNSELPLPENFTLSKNSFCYDLKYNSPLTQFTQWVATQQAQVIPGIGMFIEQGAEAFYVWTKQKPQTQPVLQAAKQSFYQSA